MAAEVGSAFVSLMPSARGFGKGIDKQVGPELRSSGSRAGKMFGSVMKAGALGVLGGAALAVGFAKGAIGEAREAQKVGAQTTQVIKSTGGVAQVTAKHVGDLSNAISKKSGIDDEAIQKASNLLLTFTDIRNEVGKNNDVFDQATQAATDMGAALGKDPRSSAILLGKALNDPVKGVTALTKVGVKFSDQQKAQNKALVEGGDINALNALGYQVTAAQFAKTQKDQKLTYQETVDFITGPLSKAKKEELAHYEEGGHKIEAQKNLLKELNTEFGGSAAATATAGDKFKVAFDNLKESVGTALLPVFDKVLGKLTTFVGYLQGPEFGTIRARIEAAVVPAFKAVVAFVTDKLIPAFKGVASKVVTALGDVKGKIQTAFGGVDLGTVVATLVGFFTGVGAKVGTALSDVQGAISSAFGGVSLGTVAENIATQAQGFAQSMIDGFTLGLDTGDWSKLGAALGTAIIGALKSLSTLAGKLGTVVGDLFAKVDWVGIGIAIGKQVPSLLIGLAAGILNFDLMGLLGGLAKHWQDILLAVLAVAFTPGRIVGKVAEVLARIPFAGKLLSWALLAFKKLSDGIVKAAGRALGFLGKAFMTGFRRVFPAVGKSLTEQLSILPTRLALLRLALIEKALAMVKGIGSGIAKGIGSVVAKIGELIGRMLKPFANLGGRVLRSIGDLTKTLYGKGTDIVRGLWNGIKASTKWLKDKVMAFVLKVIPGPVAKALGIKSPSTVMAKQAAFIPLGMVEGIESQTGKVDSAMTRLSSRIAVRAPALEPSVGGATTGTRSGGHAGPLFSIDKVEAQDVNHFLREMQSRGRAVAGGGVSF